MEYLLNMHLIKPFLFLLTPETTFTLSPLAIGFFL